MGLWLGGTRHPFRCAGPGVSGGDRESGGRVTGPSTLACYPSVRRVCETSTGRGPGRLARVPVDTPVPVSVFGWTVCAESRSVTGYPDVLGASVHSNRYESPRTVVPFGWVLCTSSVSCWSRGRYVLGPRVGNVGGTPWGRGVGLVGVTP